MLQNTLELQPLTFIHLHSHLGYELGENRDIKYVYVLSIIGLLILIIAFINYINITTARASVRLREVAVRKIIGLSRNTVNRGSRYWSDISHKSYSSNTSRFRQFPYNPF